MNIFFLDKNPKLAAQYHCDKHLSKMIIESAQMLSAAHHIQGYGYEVEPSDLYKLTHKNHPCTKWASWCWEHYMWLYRLLDSLCIEFEYRRNKKHKTSELLPILSRTPSVVYTFRFLTPPQCMPDEFKCDDTVEAYRNYYHSKEFAEWNWGREKPWWLTMHKTIKHYKDKRNCKSGS